ncbi:MAG TPA: transposase [Mycobacterium sp.]|nr:transposase [Mycobacterium sp.]HUH70490.1 transposase [Mycobacterium sp.]
MLSAITTTGTLRFMIRQGSVGAEVFIDFCKRLLADTDGPVYLIVDGHPAHRAKATQSRLLALLRCLLSQPCGVFANVKIAAATRTSLARTVTS